MSFYFRETILKEYIIAIKIKKRYQGRQREVNKDVINESIRDKELLVITFDGEKLGILSREEALREADKRELDLVLIAPQGKPPVAKIIDYGKYRYDKKKKEQEIKKNTKIVEQKEIRLSANIGQHDLDVKIKNAIKFLEKGNKLKVSLAFKGRELSNTEVGKEKMNIFLEEIKEFSVIEKEPKLIGRFYNVYLAPKVIKKK